MLKNLKNKKKKGFTLVELVVVIAIIAILAAVLVPQITGYIQQARATEIVEEAREIVTAADSINAKYGATTIKDEWKAQAIKTHARATQLIAQPEKIDKLGAASLKTCRMILETDKYEIKMTNDVFSGLKDASGNDVTLTDGIDIPATTTP